MRVYRLEGKEGGGLSHIRPHLDSVAADAIYNHSPPDADLGMRDAWIKVQDKSAFLFGCASLDQMRRTFRGEYLWRSLVAADAVVTVWEVDEAEAIVGDEQCVFRACAACCVERKSCAEYVQ